MADPFYSRENNFGAGKFNLSRSNVFPAQHLNEVSSDAGGSTETLSTDDRNALTHMQRQEPQGQEQMDMRNQTSATITIGNHPSYHTYTSPKNNESNVSYGSSTNTLIIHHSIPDEPWSNRWVSGYTTPNIPMKPQTTFNPMESAVNSNPYRSMTTPSTTNLYVPKDTSVNLSNSADLSDLQSSYLHKSEVLKHLFNKETKDVSKDMFKSLGGVYSDQSASSSNSGLNMTNMSPRPPPPYCLYDQSDKPQIEASSKRLVDKSALSKSQPDLTHVGLAKELTPAKDTQFSRLHPLYSDDDNANTLKEIIDMLTRENHALKLEIDYARRRVAKLQRFEIEITKFETQQDALVKMVERREKLERAARIKLNADIKSLTERNAELRQQVKLLSERDDALQRSSSVADDSAESANLKNELSRKDLIIAQLVSQNRELMNSKMGLENELITQDNRDKEQQKQIDILDSALTSTQAQVMTLEEQMKKHQQTGEQVEHLKRLLENNQRVSEKRRHAEEMLRNKLEHEIFILRNQANPKNESRSEITRKSELAETGKTAFSEERIEQQITKQIRDASLPPHEKLHTMNNEELEKLTERIALLETKNRVLRNKQTDQVLEQGQQSQHSPRQYHTTVTVGANNESTRPQHKHSTSISVPSPPRKDEELDITSFQSYPSPVRDGVPGCGDASGSYHSSTSANPSRDGQLTDTSAVELTKVGGYCESERTLEEAYLAKELEIAQRFFEQSTNNVPTMKSEREAPPPYHGTHHSIVKNKTIDMFPPQLPSCHRSHPPNAFCRICQNVRRSHRENAAALVRRAHSTSSRKSAPSPTNSLDSLEDCPSILERLKKECEMGFLSNSSISNNNIESNVYNQSNQHAELVITEQFDNGNNKSFN